MAKVLIVAVKITGLLLLLSNCAWAQLTTEQEDARSQGLFFLNMISSEKASPFLEISAGAGDTESQYYLAEILRRNNKFITPKAQALYEAAAEKGDIYSMMRMANKKDDLCHIMENCPPDIKTPQQWSETARALAKERAAQGDGEAMQQLFLMTTHLDWLIKAAEAGFPEAQEFLGSLYKEGVGTFLIPGNREKEIEKWYKASAEGGYPPGMNSYADLLHKRGDRQGYGYWIERSAKAGHFGAMSGYAAWTAHMPDEVGYPLDLVKAYGLTLLMAEADPGRGPSSPGYGGEVLPEVAAKMTPEQIEAGKAYAKEWAKTHPPLSRFPPKFGF
ncbi:sel1 repeat family protein [Pseudomonas sp. CCI3.2]|uniref:tetratricopeptide repeat protein n=1 Tax=unclassified Pseudomonas TaxID=196821 RepID=UPI002AC9EB5A|nr:MULTISPECIES: sel1 repeat family protein [unclassified Pseudomonas]MEB0079015.1 sel1 repeat family protein [Pseudomonas sp. MH10out]MEB0090556.1 sel1 repeat family protein [Pseudomonas sp. CCI4.2]MEB0104163.1 sel1 repeat family protein [Pseudomonas sp. CCI3.2]MEB0130689.1 sel1 repeat family protein [Pseudomonas sp. CCI2.4]MEB0156762.1 sel1 repeat family protein [Pseudomonas sp. AH2 (2023)]